MTKASSGIPWTFFLSIFIDMLTLAMLIPLLPQYQRRLGVSHSSLGLLKSCYGLLQTFSTPILGMMADSWGKRPVMMVSLLGTASSYWCTSYAVNYLSLPAFYASRLVTGATRQTMSIAGAVVSGVHAKGLPQGEARRKAVAAGMSRLSFWSSAAFSVGPLVGGVLADWFSVESATVVAGVLAYSNALLMYFVMGRLLHEKEEENEEPSKGDKRSVPTAPWWKRSTPVGFVWRTLQGGGQGRYLLLSLVLQSFAIQMAQTSLPTMLISVSRNAAEATSRSGGEDISLTKTGSVLAMVNLTWTLAQFLLPYLLASVPSYRIASAAMCCACVGYVIQIQSSASVSSLCVGLFISALCAGMADTINKSTFSSSYKASAGGEVMSVVYSIDGFNKAVAPIVWGLLMDWSAGSSLSVNLPPVASLTAALTATILYLTNVVPLLHRAGVELKAKKTE